MLVEKKSGSAEKNRAGQEVVNQSYFYFGLIHPHVCPSTYRRHPIHLLTIYSYIYHTYIHLPIRIPIQPHTHTSAPSPPHTHTLKHTHTVSTRSKTRRGHLGCQRQAGCRLPGRPERRIGSRASGSPALSVLAKACSSPPPPPTRPEDVGGSPGGPGCWTGRWGRPPGRCPLTLSLPCPFPATRSVDMGIRTESVP